MVNHPLILRSATIRHYQQLSKFIRPPRKIPQSNIQHNHGFLMSYRKWNVKNIFHNEHGDRQTSPSTSKYITTPERTTMPCWTLLRHTFTVITLLNVVVTWRYLPVLWTMRYLETERRNFWHLNQTVGRRICQSFQRKIPSRTCFWYQTKFTDRQHHVITRGWYTSPCNQWSYRQPWCHVWLFDDSPSEQNGQNFHRSIFPFFW